MELINVQWIFSLFDILILELLVTDFLCKKFTITFWSPSRQVSKREKQDYKWIEKFY